MFELEGILFLSLGHSESSSQSPIPVNCLRNNEVIPSKVRIRSNGFCEDL